MPNRQYTTRSRYVNQSGCVDGCTQNSCNNPCPGTTARNVTTYPYGKQAIAMAYVPWQNYGETFCAEEAIYYGTIFPELALPFHRGRCGS